VTLVKILQMAAALHGAKMQTSQGTLPIVVWALVENDDGSNNVVGLAVAGEGDRSLVGPDPETFQSYPVFACSPSQPP
jgi:hypothetical protein